MNRRIGPFLSSDRVRPTREISVEVIPIRKKQSSNPKNTQDIGGHHLLERVGAYSNHQYNCCKPEQRGSQSSVVCHARVSEWWMPPPKLDIVIERESLKSLTKTWFWRELRLDFHSSWWCDDGKWLNEGRVHTMQFTATLVSELIILG